MTRHEEVRRACIAFHEANPEVWDLFVQFTLEKIAQGHDHYGVGTILERVRWETDKGGTEPALKINNNFKPFFARAFAKTHPEHEDFFRTRKQTTQHRPPSGPEPDRWNLT